MSAYESGKRKKKDVKIQQTLTEVFLFFFFFILSNLQSLYIYKKFYVCYVPKILLFKFVTQNDHTILFFSFFIFFFTLSNQSIAQNRIFFLFGHGNQQVRPITDFWQLLIGKEKTSKEVNLKV